jgi:hypothetical protein
MISMHTQPAFVHPKHESMHGACCVHKSTIIKGLLLVAVAQKYQMLIHETRLAQHRICELLPRVTM